MAGLCDGFQLLATSYTYLLIWTTGMRRRPFNVNFTLKETRMKLNFLASAISATLFVLGASAHAQNPNPPVMQAAPDPAVGGQASTKTPTGVPNPSQRPAGAMPASPDARSTP